MARGAGAGGQTVRRRAKWLFRDVMRPSLDSRLISAESALRPMQSLWAKKICEALHYYDFSEMEIVTVYLNHEYERTIQTE